MTADPTFAPQLIGKARADLPHEDPGWWAAGLYRSGDGYLLAGAGGPDSEFAPAPGEKGCIRELDETEAYNWAASHLTIDQVEEFFDHLTQEI
ncbi:hypothetical protein [Mangrovicoccus sp. HB161399]|uniref:hypothetical protein n=1 Tax=Mangrovicoccus sp. HB161399 TaxID=2720392 RepID=UPI001557EDF1|nr:hypothetical protein [Mangrovicoccus sp. HB161399]